MYRRGMRAALAILLLSRAAEACFPQAASSAGPGISVESSVGRAYLHRDAREWSPVYSGRSIALGQQLETSDDATVELAIGELHLELLPLTVAEVMQIGGTTSIPSATVRVTAGAVAAKMPKTGIRRLTLICPFGTITTSNGDFTLDGNRLRVSRGAIEIKNSDGRTRTVEASEELSIAAHGALARPARYR